MESAKENLFALGDCEELITALEHERGRLPEGIAAAEARVQATREAVQAAREYLEEAEKERRANEARLQDCEAQRQKFQSQTALVKTNAEYSALLREIDGMTQRISETEETILLGMEAIDEATRKLESIESEQRAVEEGHLAEIDKLRARLAEVEEELGRRRSERTERLSALGSEAQALYERVAKVHGTGVARIKAGICAGCHRSVQPQVINLVLAGELHACSNCQRILVGRDD
jgi:predicted  nucleic acid-binding Zn-ribbon protein